MMSYPFTKETYVKDIVNEMPKAADIFKKNKIDFCCGGHTPLNVACEERSVDIDRIMAELIALYESENTGKEDVSVWTNSPSEEIVKHIQDKYHRPLEVELAQLSPYVTKVYKVHGESHPELKKVYELFYELKKELLEHTEKEDTTVFPMLLKLEDPTVENKEEIIAYIKELEREHDRAGDIIKELREITDDFTPPIDACGTYRLVYQRLEMLEEDLFMHIHLENNILFPRYL